MTTVTIELDARSYPIEIGRHLLTNQGIFQPYFKPGSKAVVVTNEKVGPLYLDALISTLAALDVIVYSIVLPDGEEFKNGTSLNDIYDHLLVRGCDRSTTIVALGGGVIGDLAGFAAATYQRGIPFIQVPTTLLAQVDSSVGGKTGINHPLGKNMIGAFYQPKLVVADIDTLKTLDDRDFRSGIAEIIKYGLIGDAVFFDWLTHHMGALLAGDVEALEFAIQRSCLNKKRIVDADECEKDQRALLNLGHTFGHAIETATGYGQWRHGEAVAAGMVMAADLSCRMGKLSTGDVEAIVSLIQRAKLPVKGPLLETDKYLNLMALDKKNHNGRLRLVLLEAIGQGIITEEVLPDHLLETLRAKTCENPLVIDEVS